MTGTVRPSLERVFPLRVRSVSGREQTIDCVLDTGFDGELALPGEVLDALGAPWSHTTVGRLANGTIIDSDTHEVDVFWNNEWTTALVEDLADPLIGVRMCRGLRLSARFVTGETVTLD